MTSKEEKRIKTKTSVSIIGDAFVDLICYVGTSNLPALGTDTTLHQPIRKVAGGSGLNTATHLSSIESFYFTEEDGGDEQTDVTLQTALNEQDEYGAILKRHAKDHGFQIINCSHATVTATTATATATEKEEDGTNNSGTSTSTGHCVVIVTKNERSFLTYPGVIQNFKASSTILHELIGCRTADPTFTNHHHHIHIAGYYNLPGFWNGNMKKRLKLIREKRRAKSHNHHIYTTTTSLVPQYDATNNWDGQLLDLLPMIDFLILNVIEAGKIANIPVDEKQGGGALNRAVLFLKLARFFGVISPYTYIIITLGKKGSVVFHRGNILASQDAPQSMDSPVDPTGAGDAFVAGFLHSVLSWRRKQHYEQCFEIGSSSNPSSSSVTSRTTYSDYSSLEGSWNEAVIEGMKWGCVLGTACVMRKGASAPCSKHDIEHLMASFSDYDHNTHSEEEEEDYDDSTNNDNHGENESNEDDSEYIPEEESESESDYDSSSSYYDDSQSSDNDSNFNDENDDQLNATLSNVDSSEEQPKKD